MTDVPPLVSHDPPSGPRLEPGSEFTFRCGSDLECFTHCCRDVSIVLTPYDVLRMKRALRMDSSEFLERYTVAIGHPYPVVVRMDRDTLRCPFLTSQGCAIYADRPWACRMYPLGVAEPQRPAAGQTGFYFLMHHERCRGHGSGSPRTVRSWLDSQGLEEYELMGSSFKRLLLHESWDRSTPLPADRSEMCFMACYDLDRFRRFVFETSFLKRFDIEESRIEAVRDDDLELLELAIEWARFLLFGEQTMRLRGPAAVGARETPSISPGTASQ